MANYKSWVLTNTEQRVWEENFHLTASDLGEQVETPWSISKKTLHGGCSEGVDLIEVDNGCLRFSVLPTRGMGIWRGDYKGLTLGWNSPVNGPVHPGFVNVSEQNGLGWLQGFDEWIVRCGLHSNGSPGLDKFKDARGASVELPLTLHGRIANLPASRVEVRVNLDDPNELTVFGIVDEALLFGPGLRLATSISTKAGSNALHIKDEITNLRSTEDEFELLYHCNFGRPFLEEGAKLVAPSKVVAPRDARAAEDFDKYAVYDAPTAGITEQVYWHKMASDANGETAAMLQNASANLAVVFKYNVDTLPCFAQWKNTAAENEGYVTGLEPATNLPNFKGFERQQGRVKRLKGGETYTTGFTLEVLNSGHDVAETAAAIEALMTGQPTIHSKPVAELSPQQ